MEIESLADSHSFTEDSSTPYSSILDCEAIVSGLAPRPAPAPASADPFVPWRPGTEGLVPLFDGVEERQRPRRPSVVG